MTSLLLFCNAFELFVILWFGNEITVASTELQYCVFESDWVGQSKSVTSFVTIQIELLKKSQQLIILKVFPMDPHTLSLHCNFENSCNEVFGQRKYGMSRSIYQAKEQNFLTDNKP